MSFIIWAVSLSSPQLQARSFNVSNLIVNLMTTEDNACFCSVDLLQQSLKGNHKAMLFQMEMLSWNDFPQHKLKTYPQWILTNSSGSSAARQERSESQTFNRWKVPTVCMSEFRVITQAVRHPRRKVISTEREGKEETVNASSVLNWVQPEMNPSSSLP